MSIGLKLLAGATASVAIIVGCTVGLVIGLHSEMPGVSFSEVPGSRYHSRGDCGPCCRMIDGSAATCGNVATWWGHNMAKLARGAEGTLYSGYLDNSRALPTMSEFVMLRKTRQGAWEEGKRLPASRPANILIDRNGNVHVLAFEPTNVSVSDFVGRLQHYWFTSGDVSATTPLVTPGTVIDNDGSSETVNIRVGAALAGNTLFLAFGLIRGGQGEHLYSCTLSSSGACATIPGSNYTSYASRWTSHVGTGDGTATLGHDMYYPYAVVRASGALAALPTQDDLVIPGYYNVFQMNQYFEWSGSTWRANGRILGDLRSDVLAASRPRLLETDDLFEDSSGTLHAVWHELLDARSASATSAIVHAVERAAGSATFDETRISFRDSAVRSSLNWVRLAEADFGGLFYVGASYDRLYIGRVPLNPTSTQVVLTDVTPRKVAIAGYTPYVARTAAGRATVDNQTGLDVLLLCSDSASYPGASNYAIHLSRETFEALPGA